MELEDLCLIQTVTKNCREAGKVCPVVINLCCFHQTRINCSCINSTDEEFWSEIIWRLQSRFIFCI